MVSDKELLVQSLETYVTKTVEHLFGFSSLPAQALLRYGVRNMVDRYGVVLDVLVSKEGTIDIDLLLDAIREELKKRGGYTVFGIKFGPSDLDEIRSIYKELSKNNV